MKAHTKLYFNYFNIAYDPATGWHDYIACEYCGKEAVDIHHIDGRGKEKDIIENLIALCRDCHIKAHEVKRLDIRLPKEVLTMLHLANLKTVNKNQDDTH